MSKKTDIKKSKAPSAYRIALIVVGALLALAALSALITGLIPARCGVWHGGDAPVTLRVSTRGYEGSDGKSDSYESFSSLDGDKFKKLSLAYERMTSFKVLRGILEGVGAPAAKFDKFVKRDEIEGLTMREGEDGKKIKGFILTVRYAGAFETVMRDADGADNEFAFDTVVARIENENNLTEITAYAFNSEGYANGGFSAAKLRVMANQSGLFSECAALFPYFTV